MDYRDPSSDFNKNKKTPNYLFKYLVDPSLYPDQIPDSKMAKFR
jgi:hypothetical protein